MAYPPRLGRVAEAATLRCALPGLQPDIEVWLVVVIEWLSWLSRANGIVISRRETTDCATEVDARTRALLLCSTTGRGGSRSPDGFQIADQDVSARLSLFGTIG